MDVDLAAMVQTWSEFEEIVNRLCGPGGFGRTAMPHRLVHANGQLMDFLPFGGVEQDSHIAWPPNGEPEMNVMGFRDVFTACDRVSLDGEIDLRIAPAPAVVFLKMVAWHDSPSTRERDIEDIASFVQGYITEIIGWDCAYAKYDSVMSADDFDLEEAGAYVLGREIAAFLSTGVRGQFLAIVEGMADDDGQFAGRLASYLKTSHDHAVRICRRLLIGLHETTTSAANREPGTL
jgi:predicted nucleotidyltransferase